MLKVFLLRGPSAKKKAPNKDEPKTSFITASGTYCYLRVPDGLKNAGGSFSRMTSKVLSTQIDKNVLT
jgi:hypothetical protein